MRKNTVLTILFVLIGLVCAVGASSTAPDGSEITIRIGLLGSPDDEDYDGSLVFKDYVESRTNGRVTVEIFPSGQFCGNERECIEGLKSGVLDVHMTVIGGLGNIFGPAQVLDLPYALRDDRVAECLFDGPIVGLLREAVLSRGLNMRLMTISNTGGWRNFATVRRPVTAPEDLKGLKIRTTPAPLQQELVRMLGANATPIAWSELYSALATGVVEGTKNGVQDIVNMHFHDHIRYMILDGHSYMGALWWFSERSWASLSPDVRRIVYDGFQHLKTVTRALPMRRQIAAYEAFKTGGGQIYAPTPEEKAAFRTATSGMRDWFVRTYGREWLDIMDREVAACENQVDSAFTGANR
ncbi:MAG: TRAP transporter substrate-binding protein DctP [Alphaproteobacteria bacterium]